MSITKTRAPAPEVRCTAVGKHFGTGGDRLTVLEPLDLSLAPGSLTALVGPSGCGKSTLLRIIAGLEQPDPGGSVSIGDDEPQAVRKRGELAIAFQDASLLPWRTTAANVALAQRLARQLQFIAGRKQRDADLPHHVDVGDAERRQHR